MAQVHYARLRQADGSAGREVAVKVLRPGIKAIIEQDLALLKTLAGLVERYLADGKRLKPREVVAEFDKYLHDELDLMHEAANASQLRRNFTGSTQLIVPEVFLTTAPVRYWYLSGCVAFRWGKLIVCARPVSICKSCLGLGWRFSLPKCSVTAFSCRYAPGEYFCCR